MGMREFVPQTHFSPTEWVPREQWARETALARRLEKDLSMASAKRVRFDGDIMQIELADGRTLSVPFAWIPKLPSASADQRERTELSDHGRKIYWPELGLEVSVSGLLVGREGQAPVRSVRGEPQSSDNAKGDALVPLNEETKSAPGGIVPCACERYLKSEGGSFPTSIMFTNLTPNNVSFFWLDFKGERVAYKTSGER